MGLTLQTMANNGSDGGGGIREPRRSNVYAFSSILQLRRQSGIRCVTVPSSVSMKGGSKWLS